jgi:hydroxymethylglutaryl-CoA reductase
MGIQERKEREKERRRQQIMVAAKRVFTEKGFNKATMEDIAQEAELSPGTLYLYFKNKEELYASLSLRILQYLLIRVEHVNDEKDTGPEEKLKSLMPDLEQRFRDRTKDITANMEGRGGGILNIELVDKSDEIPNYFQILATFETVDSMGANFINSCLEEFAAELKEFFQESPYFKKEEKECEVIMSILSNYTPDCLVKASVECAIEDLDNIDEDLTGEQFAWKFEKAVRIAQVDTYRATTHNKGIFNGIDAVALATGNDFRAIEACGHTYASRDGKYKSLTDVEVKDGKFRYSLTIPLALGTVGGLTTLHPLAKISLELLGNPGATDLMRIAASVGLANNFGALKSLVTKGIQKGHMKMHLLNILNKFGATVEEKVKAKVHFETKKVSFNAVEKYLENLRTPTKIPKVVYVNK